MKKLIVCLLGAVSVLTAQKTFTYKFEDASTGPEYSRSYQIDVGKTDVHFVVFGNGKNLIDENRVINKYQYKAFVANIVECYVKKMPETQNAGCTGGTTETITIANGDNASVNGYVYHCGGTDNGNLKGDLAKAAKLFRAMVPGFDYKLSASMKMR